MLRAIVLLILLGAPALAAAADLPIFDAHIHYSHDAWAVVPPADAVALLRRAGVKRALVSSSDDDTSAPRKPAWRRIAAACFGGTSSQASWL